MPVTALCEPVAVEIASGASLSSEVHLRGRVVAGIIMPATWTTAKVTFQMAPEMGGTYVDLHTISGAELEVAGTAGVYLPIDPINFLGVNFLKVRSGTSGSAVNQAGARTLVLMAGMPGVQ